MSEKKRKSSSRESERPSKKIQTASSVRVRHVTGPDVAKPVIASSPGVHFPSVKFKSFSKTVDDKTTLLLHSSEHKTLDHTAREDDNSIENHLKHYVAVFDPESGKLQVTEAKRLTVRNTLRSAITIREEEGEGNVPMANYTSRADLTAAFGTKKSRKAAQSAAENRQLVQGDDETNNPIARAMLADVEEDEEIINEPSLTDALSNKPLPPANLQTNEIDQVYSIDTLVQPYPAENTLGAMSIDTWIARISAKKDIRTRSRFVSARAAYLVSQLLGSVDASDPELTKALQVLRYIQFLIELHTYITHLQKRRTIPRTEEWPDKTLSEGISPSILRQTLNHFFPSRTPKDHSITLLRTTILALTLHIPLPISKLADKSLITETTDISMDLALDADTMKKLFRELGCRIGSASDTELEKWGLEKLNKKRKDAAGNALPKPIFARLRFPLDFPKLSRGRPTGAR